jgi:hypothetical protein
LCFGTSVQLLLTLVYSVRWSTVSLDSNQFQKSDRQPQLLHNKSSGVLPPLVDLCTSVVYENWDDYEFDFVDVALHLKFKVYN